MQINKAAVIRQYVINDATQRVSYFGGNRRNIKNGGGHCLDVHGNSNAHNRHVHWYSCHNGLNQGWTLDTKDVHFPKYPLKNGTPF